MESDVNVEDLVVMIREALKDKPVPKKLVAYFEQHEDNDQTEVFFTPRIEIEWSGNG